jgi:hypothetical protein
MAILLQPEALDCCLDRPWKELCESGLAGEYAIRQVTHGDPGQ